MAPREPHPRTRRAAQRTLAAALLSLAACEQPTPRATTARATRDARALPAPAPSALPATPAPTDTERALIDRYRPLLEDIARRVLPACRELFAATPPDAAPPLDAAFAPDAAFARSSPGVGTALERDPVVVQLLVQCLLREPGPSYSLQALPPLRTDAPTSLAGDMQRMPLTPSEGNDWFDRHSSGIRVIRLRRRGAGDNELSLNLFLRL